MATEILYVRKMGQKCQNFKTPTTPTCTCEATLSTSAPSSPKQQPQSLSSSSGNSDVDADADANGDEHDDDGIDNHKPVLTNGKSNGLENGAAASAGEPSYQNASVMRTPRASSKDADYENTTPKNNGLNGSASNGLASASAPAATASNNNNNEQSEVVNGNGNGNGNGNATDADKKSAENGKANAADKDELYDVPVGEFTVTQFTQKQTNKQITDIKNNTIKQTHQKHFSTPFDKKRNKTHFLALKMSSEKQTNKQKLQTRS